MRRYAMYISSFRLIAKVFLRFRIKGYYAKYALVLLMCTPLTARHKAPIMAYYAYYDYPIATYGITAT